MEYPTCTNCESKMKAVYILRYEKNRSAMGAKYIRKRTKIGYLCPQCYRVKLLWDILAEIFGGQ